MWTKRPLIIFILMISVSACLQSVVEKEIDDRLDQFQQAALSCLEVEGTTAGIVRSFFNVQPPKPHWRDLKYANDQSDQLSNEARVFSRNDKIQHCYVGYALAQKRNFKTGVYAGFFKEALDVGDCDRSTHFEISDKLATIIGARLASRGESIDVCHKVNRRLEQQIEQFLLNRYEADRAYFEAKIRVCNEQDQRDRRSQLNRICKSAGL